MPSSSAPAPRGDPMLEKLPDLVGHALRGQRAGLDKTAFQAVDLRAGMAAITRRAAWRSPTTRRSPSATPPTARASRRRCNGPACRDAAASVLLIVEDADAPTPQPLVHAIVVELPAGDGALQEAALPSRDHDGAGLQARPQLVPAGELAAARSAARARRPSLRLPGVRARGRRELRRRARARGGARGDPRPRPGERLPDRHLRAARHLDQRRRRGRRAGDPAADAAA